MFLINDLKYDFSVIHKYIAQWNEKEYIQISEKLNILYKNIKVDFSKNEKQLQKEIYSKRDIEWSELNSYEIRFSKKYLGYVRREYQNSRFGSYPLHDDYIEELDSEGLTNLDY